MSGSQGKLLARLGGKRWLLRLRRGLYLILPFEAGVEGTYSVHPFHIVPYLATPHALAYWTALSYYDYTEQEPGTIFKRVGYLAELLELPVVDEIERWQALLSAGYSLLDPLAGDHGPYDMSRYPSAQV